MTRRGSWKPYVSRNRRSYGMTMSEARSRAELKRLAQNIIVKEGPSWKDKFIDELVQKTDPKRKVTPPDDSH